MPPGASVFSALGASLSQVGYQVVQSMLCRADRIDPGVLADAVASVERRAEGALIENGSPVHELRVALDLKYGSQPHAVPVVLQAGKDIADRLAHAVGRFHDEHERQYGMRRSDAVDLVSISATALGPDTGEWPLTAVEVARPAAAEARREPRSWRRDGVLLRDVPVVDLERDDTEGRVCRGPCFLEDAFTSIAVPPGSNAVVDALGGVTLEIADARA